MYEACGAFRGWLLKAKEATLIGKVCVKIPCKRLWIPESIRRKK